MSKYIVIKPRGFVKLDDTYREFEEYEASKIVGKEAFVQQQVGQEAVERKVGDYVFWISDPNMVVESEDESEIVLPAITNLTCNMLINEVEFAFGGVVVTANHRVTNDKYAGLEEQDVANIMNLFTQTDTVLVEDEETGDYIAVDRVFDALLNYSGIETEVPEDPIVEEIVIDDEKLETSTEPEYDDSDPQFFDDLEFGDAELPLSDELPPTVEEEYEDLANENLEVEIAEDEIEGLEEI